MTSIYAPDDGMTGIHCETNGFLTIELDNVGELQGDRSKYLEAITDCTAFVNGRRMENGEKPVLALSYYRADDCPLLAAFRPLIGLCDHIRHRETSARFS